MGAVSPEHVDVAVWREAHADVATMLRYGWTVTATCATCGLRVGVRLALIARVCGPATVLWGRTLACPRWRCGGRMDIVGQPRAVAGRAPTLWYDVTGN